MTPTETPDADVTITFNHPAIRFTRAQLHRLSLLLGIVAGDVERGAHDDTATVDIWVGLDTQGARATATPRRPDAVVAPPEGRREHAAGPAGGRPGEVERGADAPVRAGVGADR